MSPHVSLYTPSNRPQMWQWFYGNIITDLDFEVVFVGDVPPNFTLPPNVTFVYSSVKLSQCAYIGAKYSTGETIIQVCDDLEIYPHVLDKLYEVYTKENDYKCMVWPQYGTGPLMDETDLLGAIPMAIGGIMSRQLYDEIGGFDSQYYCNTYDADLQFRAQSRQYGGRYVRVDDAYVWERKDLSPGGLYGGNWYKFGGRNDAAFLRYQWYDDNEHLKPVSTIPPAPFINNNTLLTISQGNAQDWDLRKRETLR